MIKKIIEMEPIVIAQTCEIEYENGLLKINGENKRRIPVVLLASQKDRIIRTFTAIIVKYADKSRKEYMKCKDIPGYEPDIDEEFLKVMRDITHDVKGIIDSYREINHYNSTFLYDAKALTEAEAVQEIERTMSNLAVYFTPSKK